MKGKNKKIEELKRALEPVFKRSGVVRASVFGSFARGEDRQDSDIDILIEFSGDKTLIDLVRLQREIETLIKKKVDLLTYNSVHPRLKEYIMKDEIKIYGQRT
jgi:predicted nucleotidyltransferase